MSYIDTDGIKDKADECTGRDSVMFMQIACMIPPEEITDRQISGLIIGCTAVFLALFVVNYIDYIESIQQNMFIEWDVKTITAGDYTIEFDIEPEFFKKWVNTTYAKFCVKQNQEKKIKYVSRVEAFRDWFQQEMETRVSEMPDLGYEDQPVEQIKIAVTTFAFRNADMI